MDQAGFSCKRAEPPWIRPDPAASEPRHRGARLRRLSCHLAVSSMWPRYSGSRSCILDLCVRQNSFSNAAVEELLSDQIDPAPTEDIRELFLELYESESGHVIRLELNENVDVAVGTEVSSEDGSKKSQLPDVVASAKLGQFLFRDCQPGLTHAEAPVQI